MTNDPSSPDRAEQEIDELAKHAGASLRRPAPSGGAATVAQRGSAIRTRRTAAGFAAVGVLAVGGIWAATRNGNDPDTKSISPAAAALSPEDRWALEYVGGTAGPVAGDPVRIGLGARSAAAAEEAAAAVAFLNDSLGGINGHPVELVKCDWTTAASATACGEQFAKDETVSVVVTSFTDEALFTTALGADKPRLGAFGEIARAGVSYWPSLQTDWVALGKLADRVAPQGATQFVVVGDYLDYAPFIVPTGVKIPTIGVALKDLSSASAVAEQLRGEGAASADVYAYWGDVRGCAAFHAAMAQLGGDPIIIGCSTGGEGTYFIDGSYNPDDLSTNAGAATILAKLAQYSSIQPDPWSAPVTVFSDVLTAAKILNSVGAGATAAETRQALVDFKGPAIVTGPQDCSLMDLKAPGYRDQMSCAATVGVLQKQNGKFVTLEPIDVRPDK